MSSWTHNICRDCWRLQHPERTPTVIVKAPWDTCCFCRRANNHGIYVRRDPSTLTCRGVHHEDQ